MSESEVISEHEGEEDPEGAGLTVKNLWSSLDILGQFFAHLPPSIEIPDLKQMRLVNSTFRDLSLKTWRENAIIRINPYGKHYEKEKQLNSMGIVMEDYLDQIKNNKTLKLTESPFSKYNIMNKLSLPTIDGTQIRFWETCGPIIKFLRFDYAVFYQMRDGTTGFHYLLTSCPNLEELVIKLITNSQSSTSSVSQKRNSTPPPNPPNFQSQKFKSFTIEKHDSTDLYLSRTCHDDVSRFYYLFTLTPALETLRLNCLECSQKMIAILQYFVHHGKPLKLKNLDMILERGQDILDIIGYIHKSGSHLQQLNLQVLIGDSDEGDATFPLIMMCKDTLENLSLSLDGDLIDSQDPADLYQLCCTFSKLTTFKMKLQNWGEGSMGYPEGCSFPLLTTLKIDCFEHKGDWFDILTNSAFPSLTNLEITFDWLEPFESSSFDVIKTPNNNFDFSALKGIPKLQRLCFKDIYTAEEKYSPQFVTVSVVTPFRMLYKSSSFAWDDAVQPEHCFHYLRLENLTEFYYPAIFSVDSLQILKKWMPNIRILGVGANMESLEVISSLFFNAEEITLYAKFDSQDAIVEKVRENFKRKLNVVKVNDLK